MTCQVWYHNGNDTVFNVPSDIPLLTAQHLFEQHGGSRVRRIEFLDPICQQPNASVIARNVDVERYWLGGILQYSVKEPRHAEQMPEVPQDRAAVFTGGHPSKGV